MGQPDQEALKDTNRSRADALHQRLRKDIDELPPEHGARLLNTLEVSRERKRATFVREAVDAALKEERRLDTVLKKADNFIKKEDIMANILQGARIATGAFVGLRIADNPAYNTTSDILGVISLAGFVIDLYRNWDHDWRSIVRREHKVKKQLRHGYRAGEGVITHAEHEAERLMHPVFENMRVAAKLLSIHKFSNGVKNENEE